MGLVVCWIIGFFSALAGVTNPFSVFTVFTMKIYEFIKGLFKRKKE